MRDNDLKSLETFIDEWRTKVKIDAYQEFADLVIKHMEQDILHYPVNRNIVLGVLAQLKEKANANQKS